MAVHGGAYLFHLAVGKSDDGRHYAGLDLAAFLHLFGTHGHEPERILEGHGAAGDKGRELSEGMPSDHVGGGDAFGSYGRTH